MAKVSNWKVMVNKWSLTQAILSLNLLTIIPVCHSQLQNPITFFAIILGMQAIQRSHIFSSKIQILLLHQLLPGGGVALPTGGGGVPRPGGYCVGAPAMLAVAATAAAATVPLPCGVITCENMKRK